VNVTTVWKVTHQQHVPGQIDHHYVVFLTKRGELVVMGHFLRSGEAVNTAQNILAGKSGNTEFFILPFVAALDRETYSPDIVAIARSGDILSCVVIENAPDSPEEVREAAISFFGPKIKAGELSIT